jgi:hypothetical protein
MRFHSPNTRNHPGQWKKFHNLYLNVTLSSSSSLQMPLSFLQEFQRLSEEWKDIQHVLNNGCLHQNLLGRNQWDLGIDGTVT